MIYVDILTYYEKKRGYYAHMIAIDESLKIFAQKINARLYHAKPFPHYDITQKQRTQAIELGAKEVSSRELILIYRTRSKEL